MNSTVIKFGLRAALVMVVLSSISFFFITGGGESAYTIGEVLGYLSMTLSMVFVFLGIRYYRDHENQGVISFGRALQIGLLIALFPALAFGLFDQIYTNFINPDFYQEYYQTQLEKIDAQDNASYEEQAEAIKSEMEFFSSPIVQFLVMFATVFLVGLVVTTISGLLLKKDPDE